MVIDDDDINNFLCEKVLKSAQVTDNVVSYLSAKDAYDDLLQSLEDGSNDLPDLILLDINMPVMNGWEFLDLLEPRLKEKQQQIDVAILSSSVYQKDKEKADNYHSVVDYISKPLTIEGIKKFMAASSK
jgi:CheY-like chemotaxis protein